MDGQFVAVHWQQRWYNILIQIIGTKKCQATKAAIRTCKEHGWQFQFVDLGERSLSDGEWNNIFSVFDPADLIDAQGPYYAKEGYAWKEFEAAEELREHPQLLRTPILRCKGRCALGNDLSFLKQYGSCS